MGANELASDLELARQELFGILATVTPDSMTTPGLVGEWSARDLIAHLGYWAGHATEVIHLAEQGRIDDIGVGEPSVDETNATVARIAGQTDLATVRKREAASVEALTARLAALDPTLFALRLPDGATLEEGIAEDAGDHYREHLDELRRALGDAARA